MESQQGNSLSRRNKLYLEIDENLTEDKVKSLQNLLITDHHIARGKIQDKTPHDIFNMLEADGKIGEGNLGLLKDVLTALKETQLAKKVEDMENGEIDISGLHSKLGFRVEALQPKAGGEPVKGSSIPLILPNDLKYNAATSGVEKVPGAQRTSLYVVSEALELLEGIEEPVSVISICGPCRSGKSYILSRLLGTADAFELGHSMDPQTFGIWMGTKVLRGKDFTIVLLDTEGIDSVGGSAGQDASILVLTILLSSQLIYNSLNVPKKTDLEKMECFIHLAKGITVKQGEKMQTSHFREFFPDFLWLLRDVSLKMMDKDGTEMNPTEYLKTKVLVGNPEEFEESQSEKVGRAILTFFPSVECTTLERPSVDSDVMNNIAQHTDSLNPKFNKGVEKLVAKLLLKARAKKAHNKTSTVSGEALSIMAKQYVEAVNDPNAIPDLDNTWKNTVQLMRDKAYKEAIDEYNQLMKVQVAEATNNWQDPLEESPENGINPKPAKRERENPTTRSPPSQRTLMDLHEDLFNKVKDRLLEKVGHFGNGSEEMSDEIDRMKKRLVERKEQTVEYVAEDGTSRKQKGLVITGGELFQYSQQNKELSKVYCEELYERLLGPIRKHVESPPEGYNFQQLMEELGNARQQYNEQARGPEKWIVLQEMTQKIKVLQEQQKTYEANLRHEKTHREVQEMVKQSKSLAKKVEQTQRTQVETMRKIEEFKGESLQNMEQLQSQVEALQNMKQWFEKKIKEVKREMAKLQKIQELQAEKKEQQAENERELSRLRELMEQMEHQQAEMAKQHADVLQKIQDLQAAIMEQQAKNERERSDGELSRVREITPPPAIPPPPPPKKKKGKTCTIS